MIVTIPRDLATDLG
ncbi:Protein of unknown function [Escherichia coli D6-113.11]|nr:Protein of unknown function [Escherichia coli D6-113.11]CDU34618.1 Protein of unknown function [Escherichia coli D6-113.11]